MFDVLIFLKINFIFSKNNKFELVILNEKRLSFNNLYKIILKKLSKKFEIVIIKIIELLSLINNGEMYKKKNYFIFNF